MYIQINLTILFIEYKCAHKRYKILILENRKKHSVYYNIKKQFRIIARNFSIASKASGQRRYFYIKNKPIPHNRI